MSTKESRARAREEQKANEIVVWTCPFACGYTRPYSLRAFFQARIIDHQVYGPIRQTELVKRDIFDHRCHLHLEALARLREKLGLTDAAA